MAIDWSKPLVDEDGNPAVLIRNAPSEGQAKADSLMEALTNTSIGFGVSLVTWICVSHFLAIPMTWGKNLQVTGIFTIVSIVRQYALRRMFNGRTVWLAIKGKFNG